MAVNEIKNTEIEIEKADVIPTELSNDELANFDEKKVVAKLEKVEEIEAATREEEKPSEEPEETAKEKNVFIAANFKLGLRLCIFVTLVVLALATVNYFTAPVIADNQAAKGNVARSELVPSAEAFVLYEGDVSSVSKNVSEIYLAQSEGKTSAYCVNITASGFGGDIELVVALDDAMKLCGVKAISHSETANIGAAALDAKGKLLPQFSGLSATAVDDVVAVSGATVTSKAVKAAVGEAVEVVRYIEKEGEIQ